MIGVTQLRLVITSTVLALMMLGALVALQPVAHSHAGALPLDTRPIVAPSNELPGIEARRMISIPYRLIG